MFFLQLIRECKEVLLGAVMVKQYYQQMISPVLDESEERNDVELEQFEEDLRQILDVSSFSRCEKLPMF